MSSAIFPIVCAPGEWTEVAVGSEYSDVIIQTAGGFSVRLALSLAQPEVTSNDFIVAEPGLGKISLPADKGLWAYSPTNLSSTTLRVLATEVETP